MSSVFLTDPTKNLKTKNLKESQVGCDLVFIPILMLTKKFWGEPNIVIWLIVKNITKNTCYSGNT